VEIVGIVGGIHESGPAFPVVPEVYLPTLLSPPRTAYILVRADIDPQGLANEVRAEVSATDRDQAGSTVKTLNELIDSAIGRQRLTVLLLGAFAGVALLRAAIDPYALIAYAVAQRTEEVSIRSALGAQTQDILRLMIGQGLGLTMGGVVLGVGGALALTPLMRTLPSEVSGTDSATFAAMIALLLVVALGASYLPARRARRINPARALR
jgi:putative ABC transport system permease protein